MCVAESRSSGICMLRERERERERAEMVNARFIQKNIEKDFKKQPEDVYIFVKRQRISKRKKERKTEMY